MRYFLSLVFFLLCTVSVFAQPVNDECDGIIDLGVVPYCPDNEFFTNVDATESDTGIDNFPTGCDNGDIAFVGRDVWFQFTTDAITTDYTVTCTGITDGMGSTPLSNPQVSVYRGDCSFDNLFLVKCGTSPDGSSELAIDVIGLDPNTDYFIRINDWSPTAAENWGTFQLCVAGLDPVFVMGEDTDATVCAGTLYDSGGETGDYGTNENNTFTLCPAEFHECILINVANFNMENGLDQLQVFEGDNTSGLLIATLTGGSSGTPFEIEASSQCVTFQFTSDGSVQQAGFELTWECTIAPCTGSSVDNPTVIADVPYDGNGLSTCGEAATVGESPCNNSPFINGPDYVFTYDSPGDICISVEISGADAGTGVLVLDGPPGDAGTTCVASSPAGIIGSADLTSPGTYYIIVANAAGCTDFNIEINETECILSASLADALCNPLNGCAQIDSTGELLPSVLFFEDGFQDIPVVNGVNSGCWFGVGIEPDFYWFTIEAQADGPFGFILESADNPSDIDFNVWGPFTQDAVCDSSAMVIDFITNNQPIRSSYAGGADPTGLADVHPGTGLPVLDEYDCAPDPNGNVDDFVTTIAAQTGEHYVVLVNDWGNQIAGGGIEIDWSPSDPAVLDPALEGNIPGADTTLCAGGMVQIQLPDWINDIEWIDPTGTLSCGDCNDPIATPLETTVYKAVVSGVCLNDTIEVEVFVYDVDLGPDITVCLGEASTLSPTFIFNDVTYNWTGPGLSCTSCPTPMIPNDTEGTFTYIVEMVAPGCTSMDTIDVIVLSDPAPAFNVTPDTILCLGEPVSLGDDTNDPSFVYTWTSNPDGLNSDLPNPTAYPVENTTFYVTVESPTCPVSSMDSVFVEVSFPPVINVANDTLVCQGEFITMGTTVEEPGVTYSWSPDTDLSDPDSPNPLLTANASGVYVLTATRGACTVTDTVNVMTSIISVEIDNEPDTITICRGEEVTITATAEPVGIDVNWTTDNGSFTGMGNSVDVSPDIITTYYAEVNIPGCLRVDTFTIDVDSIPLNLDIMPSDTAVCEGEPVILSSEPYQQADFPDIEFEWTPPGGQQSPDSLLNMVISITQSTWYYRTTTNGVCTHIDSAFIEITPTAEITITPDMPAICSGDEIQLMATSVPAIDTFTWSPEGSTISCTECPDPVVSPTSTTTYTVEGEFEGCPVMATVNVEVTQDPILDLINDASQCAGVNVTLNNLMTPAANTTYTWTSNPAGFTSSDVSPTVAPNTTTTYFVTADNGVCPPVTDEVTITVTEAAMVDASDDISICQDEELILSATGNSEAGSYLWTPTGSTSNSTEAITNSAGTTTYYVEFDNNCGTPALDSVVVTVYPGIVVDLEFSDDGMVIDPPSFIEGQVVDVTAIVSPNNVNIASYQWTFDQLPLPDNGPTVSVMYNINDTWISVVVTTEDGCANSLGLPADVEEALFKLPNAFTPDADGINDYFNVVSSLEGFMDIQEFQIYSRWGALVYDNTTPDQGWDGTYKGKPAASDVYIYRIVFTRPSGVEEVETGEIHLIR